MIGLAATWTKAVTVTKLLDEFQKIVLDVVKKIIIPILPIYIAFTFCSLAYEGSITKQFPVFVKVIIIVHGRALSLDDAPLLSGRRIFR